MSALLGLMGSFGLIQLLTSENKFNHQIHYVRTWGREQVDETVWVKYQSGSDNEEGPLWTI